MALKAATLDWIKFGHEKLVKIPVCLPELIAPTRKIGEIILSVILRSMFM